MEVFWGGKNWGVVHCTTSPPAAIASVRKMAAPSPSIREKTQWALALANWMAPPMSGAPRMMRVVPPRVGPENGSTDVSAAAALTDASAAAGATPPPYEPPAAAAGGAASPQAAGADVRRRCSTASASIRKPVVSRSGGGPRWSGLMLSVREKKCARYFLFAASSLKFRLQFL